ncbi:MAG: aryl-sulfate sulfotransferase [Spirochaetales bacterium]|nr:aryl-sulfate sulfotransferase [Spirochaetales bacterium]
MKKLISIMLMAGLASLFAYETLLGPTELLYHNEERAYEGYTLFGVGSRTYLLDMNGEVVHTWPIGTNPHLLDNGHILDAANDDPSGTKSFKEVDWEGNTVWEYTETRPDYHPHHDWNRIYNKALGEETTLYIANVDLTNEEVLAAGADPSKAPYEGVQMDAVVEVDREGKVIWEWRFFDHVIQNLDPTKPNYAGEGKDASDYPEKIDLNLPGKTLRADWLHCNSLDYNPVSGHIVINSVQGELYVIDHDGTFVKDDPEASIALAAGEGGDFLYRFGDPARYGQGDPPRVLENWDNATSGHKQMGGSHDVHWVDEGLPGAGNIMVFNNGQYLFQRTPSSSMIEINPFLDKKGVEQSDYVNPPDAGYRRETYHKDTHNRPRFVSVQVVDSYQPVNNHGMFSHIGSSAQRLPNGNLFLCSDTEGHFFEVTGEGKLAWEYINPITKDGAVKILGDMLPMTNSVFRAYRIGLDHPAVAGRTLEALGTITELADQGMIVFMDNKKPPAGEGTGGAAKGGQNKKKSGGKQ